MLFYVRLNLNLHKKAYQNFKIQISFIHVDNGDVKIWQLSRSLLDIENENFRSKWSFLLETNPQAFTVTLRIHYCCKRQNSKIYFSVLVGS